MQVIIWYLKLLILLKINQTWSDQTKNCEKKDIQQLCIDQEQCDTCLLINECCNWCYDKQYTGRRCNVLSQLSGCNSSTIETNRFSESQTIEPPFTSSHDSLKEDAIQITPQSANILLKTGIPVNVSFTYKPAKNYPLDLYYLGDLSISMQGSLTMFQTLGRDLASKLGELTENYRLAYGSFLDKTAMPFYYTDPTNYDNPCLNLLSTCEKGYLFKHRLGFTDNVTLFTEKVSNSHITANVDDLDGALDAIYQILVCGEKLGWSKNSRKIILLPTDSLLHMAGDGLLAGAVVKLPNDCLIDEYGNHMDPLKYDYPSLGDIKGLLEEKKVNIIFAVNDTKKMAYYDNITKEIFKDSAFVGELEKDSRNIMELISQGFYNFVRKVSFFINTTYAEHIDVKFFGNCDFDSWNETSTCYNVKTEPMNFIVQLTVKQQPKDRDKDTLYIEERNINEKVTLNIEYFPTCKCANYTYGENINCQHGNIRCGTCDCQNGWTGQNCEQECDEYESASLCRWSINGTMSKICSGNGNCNCGKCECSFPYDGNFCQYECPTSDGKKCGGPYQGTCREGKCICKEEFTGENCGCSTSTDRCTISNATDICSGNGECLCNRCQCKSDFSGPYCQLYKYNNIFCEDYKLFVEEAFTNGTYKSEKNNVSVEVEEIKDGGKWICERSTCTTIVFQNNSRCLVDFCYHPGKDGDVHILASPSCFLTAGMIGLTAGGGIIAAILLGGLIFIAFFKCRLHLLQKAEYAKFEQESKNWKGKNEENPLYKSPVREYTNPHRFKMDEGENATQ